MRKRQSIPEAHQQYHPVRVKKKYSVDINFFFLQHHHCPGADEPHRGHCWPTELTPSIHSNIRSRTAHWVGFICRYVILFRSHLSLAPRSSYRLRCNVFLSAQCQTTSRRQFYSSHLDIYNDYIRRQHRRFRALDMIHKPHLGWCPELLAPHNVIQISDLVISALILTELASLVIAHANPRRPV